MNRKKSILIFLAVTLAISTGLIMSGAISFFPAPDVYLEIWESSIQDTGFDLYNWTVTIVGPDSIQILLSGQANFTAPYTFKIRAYNQTGGYIVTAERTIQFTSGIPRLELFTLSATDISPQFKTIDIEVTR